MLLSPPLSPATRTKAEARSGYALAIALLTALALVLRLALARGDLWLDEIWSFRLLDGVTHFASIFFALPYDNNHLLNTAWLALVGPSASPLLARLPAIVFGTLCVPVAARIGARRHPFAALFAAALFACNGLLVHYGSEARGYSGLILASLLAIDRLEVAKQAPERRSAFVGLGVAIAFGTLSQLTMVATSLVICADAAAGAVARVPSGRRLLLRTIVATVLGTLPAALCLAVSVSVAQLHTGVQTRFSWPSFADGLARMAEATVGLPDKAGDPVLVIIAVASVCAGALILVPPGRRTVPASAIFGVPALQAALHLPNEQFARFHLISSLGVLLLAIEVFARLACFEGCQRHRIALWLGAFLSCIVLQAPNLVRLTEEGRGSYLQPVVLMGAAGPTTFIVHPQSLVGETDAVVAWYAAKSGASLAPERSSCAARAHWLIVVREPGASLLADDQRVNGSPGCSGAYALARAYPSYGLSGFTWLLFRREDGR